SPNPQSQTMIDPGWGPKALFARLSHAFVSAFAPQPLNAFAVATSTGGKTSTLPKSKVGKLDVSTLTVLWTNQPPPVVNGTAPGTTFHASVTVSASGNSIAGTCVYLTGTANNGTPTKLTGPQDNVNCTNPPNGDTGALSIFLTAANANAGATLSTA